MKSSQFEPTLLISTHSLEHGLEIRIEDNGIGIAAHQKDRIFNPFYTTKSPDQGHVGLGLWISYDIIVQEHQGKLDLKSENGSTLCIIRLPRTDNSHSSWSEELENTAGA